MTNWDDPERSYRGMISRTGKEFAGMGSGKPKSKQQDNGARFQFGNFGVGSTSDDH
jgi:hypothetical protein